MLPVPNCFAWQNLHKDIYSENPAAIAEEAEKWRLKYDIRPAELDTHKIVAFGIDCQISFCSPNGSLYVKGAKVDMERVITWIYHNLAQLTNLCFSLDTHSLLQIFHPAYWYGKDGKHPAPFTQISLEDVESGKWTPCFEPELARLYIKELEQTGKYTLTIWPYHALQGGIGHALVPELMNAALFHSFARMTQPKIITKGESPYTENYSVLTPEVTELGSVKVAQANMRLLRDLRDFDRIYVFGEAKSHCVLSTLQDIANNLEEIGRGEELSKFYILTDAMSPVAPPPLDPLPPELNFPKLADEAFKELEKRGMKMVKTTDPI